MIGIALDSLSTARRYRTVHQLPFVVAELPSGKLRALYRARAVPMLVLLDSAGRVLYTRAGVLNTEAAVDSLVGAAVAPSPLARPTGTVLTSSIR